MLLGSDQSLFSNGPHLATKIDTCWLRECQASWFKQGYSILHSLHYFGVAMAEREEIFLLMECLNGAPYFGLADFLTQVAHLC